MDCHAVLIVRLLVRKVSVGMYSGRDKLYLQNVLFSTAIPQFLLNI